ncbi:MAG: hypothetical protein WCK60_00270 [Candidatus Nomurabacteria bacterium]
MNNGFANTGPTSTELSLGNNETSLEKKQQKWDEKMAEMVKPDTYGYVLDEGIRETVVALQLLGFNTTQSDQGNYGNSPWVEVKGVTPEYFYKGEKELRVSTMLQLGISPDEVDERSQFFNKEKQVDLEEGVRKKLMNDNAPYTEEYKKWREETLILAERLEKIIKEFYLSPQKSTEPSNLHVYVQFPYRTHNHPPYIQDTPFLKVKTSSNENLSEEERKQLVAQAKNEMIQFTEFLKDRYFTDNI